MSNPAPTLNQINAFNATQGTTIDFNIIGGTEVIRSNKIYIYDLSDNSLICTHLYVSTESIHELPPNTSSSIVYASGKSSADFTNNTQYYAQIQTFTDTNGTQGASGLSVAKLFWCLPTPTLTLSTIPTTISTTSYNVSATYTPNTSGGATNEIQEFQFNLYSAIGALLQTSGVVLYGEGVDLSYNFSGLEVDSTYYVTLDVTTTQGMNVSAQSNTFTVSIDTPTMGSASVVNNGCDGYISVTSNLSSEYEHEESAEAGEIMSFTTDSVNDITELDVDFSPIQDDTPWMSTQNTEPYTFRVVPTQTEDFGHESDTIIGGTVAWNQLVKDGNFVGTSNWSTTGGAGSTLSVSNNVGVVTIVDNTNNNRPNIMQSSCLPTVGHKYFFTCDQKITTQGIAGTNQYFSLLFGNAHSLINSLPINQWNTYSKVVSVTATTYNYLNLYISSNQTEFANGDKIEYKNVMCVDLTQMFGSTIADYIYSLEQGTTGAGVAWFKKLFPKDYYAYNAGELMSVKATSHRMIGFNAWDEEWERANVDWNTRNFVPDPNGARIVTKNYIPVIPNAVYYFRTSAPNFMFVAYTDDSGNGSRYITMTNHKFTVPSDCNFVKFGFIVAEYGAEYKYDTCLNLSWDGERDGEYEEYVKHEYPLDSTLTLRGIPKLDNNNRLYYDGDTYESDGTVTRKYGIVDLSTLNYMLWNSSESRDVFANIPSQTPIAIRPKADNNDILPAVCIGYSRVSYNETWSAGVMSYTTDSRQVAFVVPHGYYADADAFKTSITGKYLVYELATPTTEAADPYTNPQIVDPHGTEEYVGSPIPVGHKTTYQRICPISGWDSVEVDVVGKNLFSDNVLDYIRPQDYFVCPIKLEQGAKYTASVKLKSGKTALTGFTIGLVKHGDRYTEFGGIEIFANATNWAPPQTRTFTITSAFDDPRIVVYTAPLNQQGFEEFFDAYEVQFEKSETATPYTPYQGNTYTIPLGQTVYGGTVEAVEGKLTDEMGGVDLGDLTWLYDTSLTHPFMRSTGISSLIKRPATSGTVANMLCSAFETQASYDISTNGKQGIAVHTDGSLRCATPNMGTDPTAFKSFVSGIQLVYEKATPTEISLTPQQIQTLSGQNNIWSNTNGGMSLIYQLPITSLLVKRRDVADVSGKWLTLYSTPITQADDMDFTFIDFLNQYGKTYQYALVPVLAQDQSGVVVQIEGGYTVSDNVDSIFDGVYIADQTNVERVKAGVGYGNIDMNQGVGSITPIGSKYPIVITNSQNQYHNGSIRGTIVPNDFYSNGNLSRIDMVNKRDELEQFLTNKRAKIIKDWNGKMWLVMIMSNVNCSFDDNYGMGMVSFSADWLEVGDPTNQQDLYNAGLINVGGV